jgi:hypothetical protein
MKTKLAIILAFLGVAMFGIYFATSEGHTSYDYFIRLANAILDGKYYLTDNPSWLSELIPIGESKYTFVNPPMPAFMAIPFVYILGSFFNQEYLAQILGSLSVVVTGLIALKIRDDKRLMIWAMFLLGLGSIFWYLSSTGSVWYLGQVSGVFFMLLAINQVLGKKSVFLTSLFLMAAFLSRLQLVFSLPFFVYLLFSDKVTLKKLVLFCIPLGTFALIYCGYNFLRFGDLFENGYTLIPNILSEPWFNKGQFSFSYIPNHLYLLFQKTPIFQSDFPYIKQSWAGMAIWITTPAFIYALFANLKDRINLLSWTSVLLIGLVNFSYGSTGFSQFGYRYAVDFYPFLVLLTIKSVSKTGVKWHHWTLLIISIIVNLWGVLWINKFGWVSF